MGVAASDPYETLRVHRTAPLPLIQEVYWHLVDLARRDVHEPGKREAVLRELNAAYTILANPGRRALYDAGAPDDHQTGKRRRPGQHAILNVHPTASVAIIEIAFRTLSQRAPAGTAARRSLETARASLIAQASSSPRTIDDASPITGQIQPDEEAELTGRFLRAFGKGARPQEALSSTEPHDGSYPSSSARGATIAVDRPAPAVEARPALVPRRFSSGRPHEGLPRDLLVRHSVLPVRREDGTLELAVTRADDIETARALARGVGAQAIVYRVGRSIVQDGLVHLYRNEDAHEVARGHAERTPEMSAQRTFTLPQIATGALLLVALSASLYFFLMPTLIGLVAACTAFYLASSAYKMFVVAKSLTSPGEVPIDQAEVAALDERTLPTYTLLLPLYREANIVEHLLTGIDALDYPRDKLDVKLLLEPDDAETVAAVKQARLPSHYQLLIVPSGGPKAKPKALNYGLLHARGELCTIYDAEDRPQPDQLKKAVIAFRRLGSDVGCVQAKLNFYNPDQNLLTRWFTADYSQWFDLYLPGLTGAGAPIPLGGTSNHFRTALLRELGGWDPYNVTEDADLGIRLARAGLRTAMIDSVTYEEANSRLGNWLRQRSHWIKGYMLTWLVHMRNPLRLWRELGTHGFLSIQMTIAGSVFGYFANPVFWALIAAWYGTRWGIVQGLYPAPVLYLSIVCLFFANFVFVYVAMAGCARRGFYGGTKYSLLIPAYWALMTVSAVHALYQLLLKPHYWEKTRHGLTAVTAATAFAAASTAE